MKIQKLQNYKPKDTRKAVPTHYTLLFDAYVTNPEDRVRTLTTEYRIIHSGTPV